MIDFLSLYNINKDFKPSPIMLGRARDNNFFWLFRIELGQYSFRAVQPEHVPQIEELLEEGKLTKTSITATVPLYMEDSVRTATFTIYEMKEE